LLDICRGRIDSAWEICIGMHVSAPSVRQRAPAAYGAPAGKMKAKGQQEVELHFDKFWVDLGHENLRPDAPPASKSSEAHWGLGDKTITALGKAAFFPQFAVFPVRYLDDDIAGANVSGCALLTMSMSLSLTCCVDTSCTC
jgi:hypothetical protein